MTEGRGTDEPAAGEPPAHKPPADNPPREAGTYPARTNRRVPLWQRKGPLVLLALLAMGNVAGLSMMPWVAVPTAEGVGDVALRGTDAVPGLLQISLVGAAASVLVLFTDGIWRRLIGVLVLLAGAGLTALVVPVATGGSSVGLQPWAALLMAVIGLLAGLCIAAFSGRWTSVSSRYRAPGGSTDHDANSAAGDPARDWDALSRGEDPTL